MLLNNFITELWMCVLLVGTEVIGNLCQFASNEKSWSTNVDWCTWSSGICKFDGWLSVVCGIDQIIGLTDGPISKSDWP